MIPISKFIGKINRHSHLGKQNQPRLIGRSRPGTLRTVLVTVFCVAAFLYGVGILAGNSPETVPSVSAAVPAATAPPPEKKTADEPLADSEADNERIITPAKIYYGDLELPVSGATGYASVQMNMTKTGGLPIEVIKELEPGAAFLIVREDGDRWEIIADGVTGWVRHSQCMINLPDVIPSIIYNCTNTYGSLFASGGKEIPGITGQALYAGKTFNERLGGEEFIVPVMYSTAKRICQAQRNAMTNGDSLVIYEAFRPLEVQQNVYDALNNLSGEDRDVRQGINVRPWSLKSFITGSVSNHQQGCAIDVSLAEITEESYAIAGAYQYLRVKDYSEYEMPSPMHELSAASVRFTATADRSSATAWENRNLSPGMTESPAAQKLQKYCADAGLTPQDSEWWHFNDLAAQKNTPSNIDGDYTVTGCLSTYPG